MVWVIWSAICIIVTIAAVCVIAVLGGRALYQLLRAGKIAEDATANKGQ